MAFSYLDEFNSVLQKGYVTNERHGKPTGFIVEVGEEVPRTFLNLDEHYRLSFSTQRDVDNAIELVRHTLKLVDDNVSLQTDVDELLTIIRDEICNAVSKDFDDDVAKLNIKVTVDSTIKDIFNYYIENERKSNVDALEEKSFGNADETLSRARRE